MQDSEVSMTKDAYFEMCEALGTEPAESEIPLEVADFPNLAQQCFIIYNVLPDVWDTMGGNYLGKNFSILFNLYDLYEFETEDRLLSLQILQHMDSVRARSVAEKLKQKSPPT
jgi:hypothetical protein